VSRFLRREGIFYASKQGLKACRYRTGRHLTDGYCKLYLPADDPLASMRDGAGYVLEHRLVVARRIGRPLRTSETVHHINGDRADNRDSNLQLRQGRHGKHVAMRCADCGSHNIEPTPLAEELN